MDAKAPFFSAQTAHKYPASPPSGWSIFVFPDLPVTLPCDSLGRLDPQSGLIFTIFPFLPAGDDKRCVPAAAEELTHQVYYPFERRKPRIPTCPRWCEDGN